jgi:DNA-binding NarL/FixJ family response regulator
MKLLLVDDHRMMREGLRAVLEKAGLEVVGDAASGREALGMIRRLSPDVVVMDISMPDLNGVDATKRLVAERPDIKVIALSMHSDRRYVLAMFRAGAVGYLLKDSACDELIRAVRAIARGQKYVSPGIAGVLVDEITEPRRFAKLDDAPLSSREREVLQLLAEGHSSKDIAQRLDVAVPTVETHRRQIMDKLNLRTVAELTKYAVREGLTPLDR